MDYQKKILRQAAYLRKKDPALARIIVKVGRLEHAWDPPTHPNHFKALIVAIINQQLSGKAADTIQKRFEALFARGRKSGRGGKKFPSPKGVLKMPTPKMRKVGLSKMKVSFMKDLARKIEDGTVDFKKMPKWTDEEVIEHLTEVKGIGRWTAEMFLMFSLGREDVFSYGDLGLRNAMQRIYKLKKHPTPRQAEEIYTAWKPYRTLASLYLWASIDNK